MGLFDSVYAPCPKCGKPVEFQSKADEAPYMNVFTIETAPTHNLIDVLNRPQYHQACGQWFALIDETFPPIPPRPSPRTVNVKPPECSIVHSQGMRYWDQQFTFDDIDDAGSRAAT